jgi:hypothetical protein
MQTLSNRPTVQRFGTILLEPAKNRVLVPSQSEAQRRRLEPDGVYRAYSFLPILSPSLLFNRPEASLASGVQNPETQAWKGAEGFFKTLRETGKTEPSHVQEAASQVVLTVENTPEYYFPVMFKYSHGAFPAEESNYDYVRYLPKQQTLAFYIPDTPESKREGKPLNIIA